MQIETVTSFDDPEALVASRLFGVAVGVAQKFISGIPSSAPGVEITPRDGEIRVLVSRPMVSHHLHDIFDAVCDRVKDDVSANIVYRNKTGNPETRMDMRMSVSAFMEAFTPSAYRV